MTAVAGPLSVTPTAHWIEHMDIAGAILTEPIHLTDDVITARGSGLDMVWGKASRRSSVRPTGGLKLWSVGNNPAAANVITGGRTRMFAASCP
jgi:hypothetical protein